MVVASLPLAGRSAGAGASGVTPGDLSAADPAVAADLVAQLDPIETSGPRGGGDHQTAGLGGRPEAASAGTVGDWFAEAARLEAASVYAFLQLADELDRHGAPVALVESALRAADDEVSHARIAAELARRFHAAPAPLAIAAREPRSLEAIAVENAALGCVGETFGAAVSLWQSEHAADPVVREAMRRIAADELSHAELAWRVAEWLHERLSAPARARVASARRMAARTLVGGLRDDPPEELAIAAGLPRSAPARAMADAALRALWT